MPIKNSDERFLFPSGGWMDSPNDTSNEAAIVIPKDTDLNMFKYSPEGLVPFTEQEIMEKLIAERRAEGLEIVAYLENYLNSKAVEYGYKDYHAAMIYINSSHPKFKEEAQLFFSCADAIWAYVDANNNSFATTGQPDLEQVKLDHPKLEDFKPV